MTARPEYRSTIRELPADERPRERLERYGARALKSSELLAILLRTGNHRQTALELGDAVMQHYGSLGALAQVSIEDVQQFTGIGPAKAIELAAAFELGRRIHATSPDERVTIGGPEDVVALCGAEMRDLDR